MNDELLLDDKPKATTSYKPIVPNNDTINQLVNMIMRDGKKIRAQKLVSDTAKQLLKKIGEKEDPYTVLADAIETASPLVKIMNKKRHAKVIHVPKPLKDRQRHHQAIAWLLDAAKKRDETTFEQRFAAEIYEVITGTSSVLQKKQQVHKQALANRANAAVPYNTQR
ncbi:30S ribosomal protein S7p/S5e [Mycotypha africana]|uniref:30S ribosomal protein S7p/S5e n=1 Tax=Mycotypha africana TaxID=64632 RepID=UPI0022FFDF99|nr:30S ribosomal protein S7p/S5e [Mycotypha africana]KAI8975400.1 30S ribosomal protein S7p/S5e [Mycotypha africana]